MAISLRPTFPASVVDALHARRRRRSRLPERGRVPLELFSAGTIGTEDTAGEAPGSITIDRFAVFGLTLVPDGNPGVIFGVDGNNVNAVVAFGTDGQLVVRAGNQAAPPQNDAARDVAVVGLGSRGRRVRLAWSIVPGASFMQVRAWIDGRQVAFAQSSAGAAAWGVDGGSARFLTNMTTAPNDPLIANGDAWGGTSFGQLAYHRFRA